MKINTFDIDGVIDFGDTYTGVRPCVNDIIITGRSVHTEREATEKMLRDRGINNMLFMNDPVSYTHLTLPTSSRG